MGCLILIITTSLGLNFFFFKQNIINETLYQLTNESNNRFIHVKRKIDEIINENKKNLNEISASYSNFYLNQKKDITFVTKHIKEKWNTDCKKEKNCQFFYYDNNKKMHIISELDDPFSLPSSKKYDSLSLNLTNGENLFLCMDYCYLHITKPLSLYDLKNGLMEISVNIDYIIDQASRDLYETDLIFLKKTNQEQQTENIINDIDNYHYLGATNNNKYENFKDIYNKKTLQKKIRRNIYTIKYKNKNYIARHSDYENITIINIKNIDSTLKKINKALNDFIINAMTFMPFIIFIFYFLLSYSMKKIDLLSEVLNLIGRKKFKKANNILNKNRRKKIHDEIDNIYNSVYVLSDELESALHNLEKTNQKLTKNIKEIRFLAEHDTLTGLYNRRRFSIEVESIIEKREPFFLISSDLNHFKLVNDSLGHSAGDDLLISFSSILKIVISKKGIVGRMGGDEFSIVIFGNDKNIAAKLLNEISEKTKKIIKKNSYGIKTSTSLGVARYPLDSDNIEGLSSYSDVAMYENKRFKTDPYNYYNGSETIVKEEREAQVWQNLINKNIQESNLIPYQQLIINSKDHTIHACEILVRIQENSKILPTADFIYYAEKNRTIIQIDKYIIKQTLKHFSLFNYPRLTINLSYLTIATNEIIEYILECRNNYNYPAKKIVFEITETVEISNIVLVQRFIKRLKEHGFSFALDDFGSGFSSFGYLANLGVDYIKIDKSLIADLPNSKTTQHIVKSIISLAKNLQIAIIAEGIESEALLKEVDKYDIDFLQGYYFSKPKPLKEHPCVRNSTIKDITAITHITDQSNQTYTQISPTH